MAEIAGDLRQRFDFAVYFHSGVAEALRLHCGNPILRVPNRSPLAPYVQPKSNVSGHDLPRPSVSNASLKVGTSRYSASAGSRRAGFTLRARHPAVQRGISVQRGAAAHSNH